MRKIIMLLKQIEHFLFGAKLPCCGYRFQAKLGNRVKCPQCGLLYIWAKFIKIQEGPRPSPLIEGGY